MRAWAGLIFHLTCGTTEVHICTYLPHLHPHTRCTYTFRNTETFLVSHGIHAISVTGSCIVYFLSSSAIIKVYHFLVVALFPWKAVPEQPPCSGSYKFLSRFQLQIIHSPFTFFVCKPKFLFSLNSSCPSLVLSLWCLQSDFSKETKLMQSCWLAGSLSLPQPICNLLAHFNQCWQGSSG